MPTLSSTLASTLKAFALGLLTASLPVVAQQMQKPPAYQQPSYQQPAQPYPPSTQQAYGDPLSYIPQGMGALAQEASWHTDFTFDRTMLALAGNLYGLDEPTRQSLARLNGITVHSYRFPTPGGYDPAAVEAVRAQYNALGWKHLVSTKSRVSAAGYPTGRTDLWVETRGMNVAGCAILLAGQSNLNLIAVSGDLSTVDLLRLRGHFGIPRFDSNELPPMH